MQTEKVKSKYMHAEKMKVMSYKRDKRGRKERRERQLKIERESRKSSMKETHIIFISFATQPCIHAIFVTVTPQVYLAYSVALGQQSPTLQNFNDANAYTYVYVYIIMYI